MAPWTWLATVGMRKLLPIIHHCHLAPAQISCIFVKIYEPASAEEKKIRPEVAALERTGSSKSRFFPYDKVLAWRVVSRVLHWQAKGLPAIMKSPCLPLFKNCRKYTTGRDGHAADLAPWPRA